MPHLPERYSGLFIDGREGFTVIERLRVFVLGKKPFRMYAVIPCGRVKWALMLEKSIARLGKILNEAFGTMWTLIRPSNMEMGIIL